MQTAKDWGLTPYQFLDLDPTEQAIMIATSNTAQRMEAVVAHKRTSDMKRRRRKK